MLADSAVLCTGPHQKPIQISRIAAQYSPGICILKGGRLIKKGFRHQRHLVIRKKITVIQAVAIPVAPSAADSSEYRKQLSESYGFKQIGEPLPENVSLKDVIDSLPNKVFEIDDVTAWKSVLISVTSYVLGLFMISKAPWYLLSLAWAWTGTVITGDRSMLYEDTAWLPVWKELFDSSPILRKAIIYGYGPFRPWMSIAYWFMWHFDLKNSDQMERVKISLACVFTFIAIRWPLIIYKTGIMGWIKFWLMPCGTHASMQGRNEALFNFDTFRIEILCHDINVHIPHHISPRIPSYNLRAAHKSLQENWGKYLTEASWNWRLMKTFMTVCHVYSKGQNYVAIDQLTPEESQPNEFFRKVVPDYA